MGRSSRIEYPEGGYPVISHIQGDKSSDKDFYADIGFHPGQDLSRRHEEVLLPCRSGFSSAHSPVSATRFVVDTFLQKYNKEDSTSAILGRSLASTAG